MFAHELATLNEYKEENRELKSSCQSLRSRNTVLENTVQGTAIALDSLVKAIKVALPSDLFDSVMKRAKQIANAPVTLADPAPDRKNRPSQVVLS